MSQNPTTNNSSPSPGWCVRFLNGPLRGRSIALKHGTNVVGSGLDCDILLQGDVLPRHLVFTVGDIAVSVQKLGTAQARLNGDDLSMQRRSTVRGDIISVGSIDFELDKVRVEGSAPETPSEAKAESALDEPATVAMSMSPGSSNAPLAMAKPWLPLRQGIAIGAVIVMATLSVVIGLYTYDSKSSWSIVNNSVDVESLHRLIADYPEVKMIDQANGKVGVRGFVESRARRAALMDILRRFGDSISINVHSADDIVEQARRYLGEQDLSVDYAGQGRLIVSGNANNEAIHDKVARLSADLNSLLAVVDDVETPKRARSTPIARRGSDLADWEKTLPSPMVGLTELPNGMRYIQLANGRRYYEGSTLKSGDELVNIEADHLVVTKPTKKQPSKPSATVGDELPNNTTPSNASAASTNATPSDPIK